jgi:Sel1 repeat
MMSAPQPSGGREFEASSTITAGASGVKWVEPVFGLEVSAEEEQRQTDEIAHEGAAPDAVPEPGAGDVTAARVTLEAATSSSLPRSARLRRGRRSPAWHGRRSGRYSPASSTMAPSAPAPPKIAAHGTIAVTHINRLNAAINAEREAAAGALSALHGPLAAGVVAALHETLVAERELAIARIVRLGAERAATAAAIAPVPGSATADATSVWTTISLLWRRDDGSRRSIQGGTGSALIVAPGSPDYFHKTGTALSPWRGPEATRPVTSRRRLVTNAFALVVATVGVVTYFGSDLWSAKERQNQPGVAATVAAAATPAAALPSDPIQRVAYFRNRAAAGDAPAQYALGVLYAQGDGVAQDYASAASWFRKAAKGGIVDAQDLAALYQRGLVTPQDFVVAAYWYRNAAEAGVEPAMPMLALLYERGQGVAVSPIDAYAWYRAAARRGDAVAGKRAAALLAKFDGADKGRAVMRAAAIVDALHEPRAAASGSAALVPGDWIGRTTDRDASMD